MGRARPAGSTGGLGMAATLALLAGRRPGGQRRGIAAGLVAIGATTACCFS